MKEAEERKLGRQVSYSLMKEAEERKPDRKSQPNERSQAGLSGGI